MNRICVTLLFLCAFVSGCEREEEQPAVELVTGITMPAGEIFTPGDEVTVRAVGIESGDEIWFEVAWNEGSEGFAPNGTAKGIRGTVTDRTDRSISFLVPGHYPPAAVTVQLFRSGRFQTLGTIRTGDGLQHETMLYTWTAAPDGGVTVARCPMSGSAVAGEEVLSTRLPLRGIVGSIGQGVACGVSDGRLVELDLITRQVQELGEGCLLAGTVETSVFGLYVRDEWLYLSERTSQPYSWRLPEGVTADRIVRQPFACGFNALLLTVRNDDGTLSPLVLPLSGSGALLGPAVASEYLIPYWMMKPADDDPSRLERVGGYAALHGSQSWFQPLDPATLTLAPTSGEADLVVTGRVVSMTQCRIAGEEGSEVRIGVLTDTDGRREAWICDPQRGASEPVPSDGELSSVEGIFFAR